MTYEKKSTPLVAVMIPVFNGEKTIARALRSLLSQTYGNWSAIVVDDGSTDSTVDIINNISDSRILVIKHSRNKGRAAARQTALENITGDYVAYLDADDFYHPEKLERQVAFMNRNPDVDFCGCGLGSFKSDKGLLRIRADYSFNNVRHHSGKPIIISPGSSMIKSSIALDNQYTEELTYGEDMDYFQRALDGRLLGCVSDVLYYYSEFDDVDAKKLIYSYIPIIKNNFKRMKNTPFVAFRDFAYSSYRFAMISVVCTIFGYEKILHRRGRGPSDEEANEFSKVSRRLEVDNYLASVS